MTTYGTGAWDDLGHRGTERGVVAGPLAQVVDRQERDRQGGARGRPQYAPDHERSSPTATHGDQGANSQRERDAGSTNGDVARSRV